MSRTLFALGVMCIFYALCQTLFDAFEDYEHSHPIRCLVASIAGMGFIGAGVLTFLFGGTP